TGADLLADAAELLPAAADRAQLASGSINSRAETSHTASTVLTTSIWPLSAAFQPLSAAADTAGLMRTQIYSYYQAVEDGFQHGHKLPPGWAPRPSDAT